MINVIGRVTRDLEMQATPSGTEYLCFDLAENKGFGEKEKTVFHRCTIWDKDMMDRIVRAKVKKGSLLQVVGDQNLSAYTNRDGDAIAQSSINVWHWEYVPGGGKKTEDKNQADKGGVYNDTPTEDCDDGLPV